MLSEARRSYRPIDRNVGKEARIRGFASLTLVRFAFVVFVISDTDNQHTPISVANLLKLNLVSSAGRLVSAIMFNQQSWE